MSIDELFQFLNYLSNKNQSGNIKPAQFNISAERCQIEYYNKQYREFQKTREVTDAISIWLVDAIINPDASGQVLYPPDYKHVAGIRHIRFVNGIATPVSVEEVATNDLGTILMSQVTPPTLKYPKVAYYNTYLQFYPKNVGAIQFDYLRGPIVPVWGYNIVNNRPVYNPATSVDFEAVDGSLNEITMMMLSQLGIYLSSQQVIQYAEQLKAEHT
jgi:hypothetical protein